MHSPRADKTIVIEELASQKEHRHTAYRAGRDIADQLHTLLQASTELVTFIHLISVHALTIPGLPQTGFSKNQLANDDESDTRNSSLSSFQRDRKLAIKSIKASMH